VKFTLKPYQEDAVASSLANLERARELFHRDGEVTSFSLTATTGAGKTVMAAAAIEALFFGNADFGFDADTGAVVIWFSDDPNLNEQTRLRLLEASDKLTHTHLVTVEPPFDRPRLEPRKVYFLNTQKLGKNSLLTRGHAVDPNQTVLELGPPPDLQGRTIWETIGNTINDDELTLYLILDEAHRGFNTKTAGDKPTIVRQLITGQGLQPPIPVVWGISATIERFQEAMKAADASKDRRALSPVIVDPSLVQESGLVKDIVALSIPNEAGNFDSVLVRMAARKLRESTERWAQYASEQGLAEPVLPLLVLQTPNTPDPDDVGMALDTIFDEYSSLGADQTRHVLGEHATQKFGAWEVPWVEPQLVEDRTNIRILIAKDAISTGWDCPRAEVLVSFRPAKDNTHITQLLGRMVRSPLARRVQGDELLNSVDCILPFFDRTTAGNVVKYLTGQLTEMPGAAGKKILLDGRTLVPNPEVPEAVWQVWDTLPTETLPQRGARPTKRLVTLAQALSADGIRPNSLKAVESELHAVLDAYATRYAKQLDAAVAEVWAVEVQQIAGQVGKAGLTYAELVERADDRAIRSGFEGAKKAFGGDVAQSYLNHLSGPDADDDDRLREAYVRAAALATVKEAREKVDQDATEITDNWFAEHRVAIKGLSDERQQVYEEILAMAVHPQRSHLSRPRTRLEDYKVVDDNGQVGVAPLAKLHLMSDENGDFPLSSLNEWERQVVQTELARDGACGWYRNPPRQAVDSLGISYRDSSGNWRSMHPDFIFFHEVDGDVRASIIDPHSHHLDDADAKLKALLTFALKYGEHFHRVEALSEVGGNMRVLDFGVVATQEAVKTNRGPAIDLYKSSVATDYDP
jgi:type III restriction enzyme